MGIVTEMVLVYPFLQTPLTTHDVYVHRIIFSELWNRWLS